MQRRMLFSFVILSFVITWGLAAGLFMFGDALTARFGELDTEQPFWNAYFHLAVYGPAFSALIVVGALRGRAGLQALGRRLLPVRVGWYWYAAILCGIPLLYGCGRWLMVLRGATPPPFEYEPWYMVIPAALAALIDDPGPVEELGWRGIALPLLQQRYSALTSSIILGVIWGVWHLPSFYVSALGQSSFSFAVFLVECIVLAIVMTAAFNGTRGSVTIAFLIHWASNTTAVHMTGPGDGLFYMTAMLVIAAVAIVVIAGPKNLGRAKYTDVLPGLSLDGAMDRETGRAGMQMREAQ